MRYVLLLTEVAQEKTLPFAPLVLSAARCAGCRSSGDVPYRVDGRFLAPIVSTGSPRQHAGSFTRKYELVNSPTPSLTSCRIGCQPGRKCRPCRLKSATLDFAMFPQPPIVRSRARILAE